MSIRPYISNRPLSSFNILAHQRRDKTEETLLIETDEKIRQIYEEKIKHLKEPLPLTNHSRSAWTLTQLEAFQTFIEKYDLRIALDSTSKGYDQFLKEHFPEITGSKSIFAILPDLIPELRGKNSKQTKYAYVNYLNPLISKTPLSLKGFLLLREGMKIHLTVAEIKKALFEENNNIYREIQNPIELKSLAIYPEYNQYTPDSQIEKMITIIRKEDAKLQKIYDLKITQPRVSLKRNLSEPQLDTHKNKEASPPFPPLWS